MPLNVAAVPPTGAGAPANVTLDAVPPRPLPEESTAVVAPAASSSFQYPTGPSARTAAGNPPAGTVTEPCPGVRGALAVVLGTTVVEVAGPVPTAFVAETRT